MKPTLAFAAVLLFAGTLIAQEPPSPPAPGSAATAPSPEGPPRCRAIGVYRIFDFLLGNWNVTIDGKPAGTNRFAQAAWGCAILETRIDGTMRSQGFYYFHPESKRWKQVWVSEQALAPNGVMELQLVDLLEDGSIVMEGTGIIAERRVYERSTLEPMGDGRVRQVIETSGDRRTWRRVLESIYEKQPPKKKP
ncbi:MAG TPA: hypothetical protein VM557_00810 [Thermoanaerobaculia bacterium]|nr:hypothetical protein [Thermoanaerobaculia bacterium]